MRASMSDTLGLPPLLACGAGPALAAAGDPLLPGDRPRRALRGAGPAGGHGDAVALVAQHTRVARLEHLVVGLVQPVVAGQGLAAGASRLVGGAAGHGARGCP